VVHIPTSAERSAAIFPFNLRKGTIREIFARRLEIGVYHGVRELETKGVSPGSQGRWF
jgi:hypothetical protein